MTKNQYYITITIFLKYNWYINDKKKIQFYINVLYIKNYSYFLEILKKNNIVKSIKIYNSSLCFHLLEFIRYKENTFFFLVY